ncbi:MAG: cytidylate kinase-like family protein [Chloroflexi bacterium]|nr:cytidylate kinase-like family protein [Chloroflexota bacterium]
MGVITISRQQGSGGAGIAAQVCELLGYRYFDKRLMAEAMAQENLTEETIIDYHEDEYRLRGFLDRLLGYRRPSTIQDIGFWDKNPDLVKMPAVAVLDEHLAVWVIRAAIKRAYAQGDVVIVGRAGQVVLANEPGVLHVRVEAPLEARIQRVVERGILDPKQARQFVLERDKASAEYLQRFYGVDWSDPLLYHLVINTGKWSIASAARCIASAVEL